MSRKWLSNNVKKRFLASLLTVTLLVPTKGMSLFASGMDASNRKQTHYNQAIVNELQKLCTNGENPRDILDELHRQGIVDETGVPVEGSTFVVDGKKMTEEELSKEAKKHKTGNVNVDGRTITWEEMNRLLTLKESLQLMQDFMGEDVEINESNKEEYLASAMSLKEQLADGKVLVYDDPTGSTYGAGISHQARLRIKPDKTTLTETGNDQVITVNVDLITKQSVPVTLHYQTLSGSAHADGSGTVTIPAGETSTSFKVNYRGSNVMRNGDSVFYIQCNEVSNALIENGSSYGKNITLPITVKKNDRLTGEYNVPGKVTVSPWTTEREYKVAHCFGGTTSYEKKTEYTYHKNIICTIKYEDIEPYIGNWPDNYYCLTYLQNPTFSPAVDFSGPGSKTTEIGRVTLPKDSVWEFTTYASRVEEDFSYTGGISSNMYIREIHERINLTKLIIPDGTFYVGQSIPITATFDECMKIDDSVKLKMADGTELTPVEQGTKGRSCTFLYQIPEIPSGNIPNITELSLNGTKSYCGDTLMIPGQDRNNTVFDLKLLSNNAPESIMISNNKCLLRYYKDASFSNMQCSIDDSIAGSQWVTEVISVDQGADGTYRKWIQSNCAPISGLDLKARKDLKSGEQVQKALRETPYAVYADETKYSISEYVKSMYLSVDGGITRIPLYVVAQLGDTTENNEIPVALIAYYQPELNTDTQPRIDASEVFMDPDIGSTYDYIQEDDEAELLLSQTSRGVVVPQFYTVKNAVFMYPGAAAIDYYNENPFFSNWESLVDDPEKLVSYHVDYDGELENIKTSGRENPTYVDSTKDATVHESVNKKEEEDKESILTLKKESAEGENDAITTEQYEMKDSFITNPFRIQTDELGFTARFNEEQFSFYGTKNLIWVSSDESIANVKYPDEFKGEKAETYGADHTAPVEIIPTGKVGSVYFTLYALNGGIEGFTPVEVCRSVTLFCEPGKEPYLRIPSSEGKNASLSCNQNESLDVCFISNLTAQNAEEARMLTNSPEYQLFENFTEFKMEVYETDFVGNPVGKPVYTDNAISTNDKTIGKMIIPEGILTKTSSQGETVYTVKIMAESLRAQGTQNGIVPVKELKTAVADITVYPNPASLRLEKLDNYSILDNGTLPISYELETNGTAPAATSLTITDSEGKTVLSQSLKQGSNMITWKPEKVEGQLKKTYIVKASMQAKSGDTPSIDSYLVYVYNHEALDILVNSANGRSSSGEKAEDKVTFDNHDKVESLISKDGKTITLDGEKVSLLGLSQDINLASMVSINYGDYVWGQISDQIKWDVAIDQKKSSEKENPYDTATTMNFAQGGAYSNLYSYNYVSYSPVENFMAVGLKNGKTVITATHARTGMKSSIHVTTNTLKDQLYLFKFLPEQKTKLEYMNGDGKACIMYSDENGELALYEESGILSDIHLFSEENGESYIGTIPYKDILSGEQDISKLQYYPVNNYKLRTLSNVHIYVTDENGAPYANKNIWVRGGVYKNEKYCYAANLGTEKNHLGDGKQDQVFTTDADGKMTVYFDSSQFYSLSEETIQERTLVPDDYILYNIELKFQPDNQVDKVKKAYQPQMVHVSSVLNPYNTLDDCSAKVTARVVNTGANTAVINSQLLCQCEASGTIGDVTDVYGYKGAIGLSKKYSTAIVKTETLMWGEEVETEPLTYKDRTGKEISYGNATSEIGKNKYKLNYADNLGAEFINQKNTVITYPFADMPVVESTWTLKKSEIDKVIPQNKVVSLTAEIYKDKNIIKEISNDFRCSNKSDEDAINTEVKDDLQELLDTISEEVDWAGSLKDQISEDNLFNYASAQLGNLISKTGLTISCELSPTKDPRCFHVMVTMGGSLCNEEEPAEEYGTTNNGGKYTVKHQDNSETKNVFNKLWNKGTDKAADTIMDSKRKKAQANAKKQHEDKVGNAEITYGGAMYYEFCYGDNGKWEVIFYGGGINAGFGVGYDFTKNFMVGPVPVTCSLDLGICASMELDTTITGKFEGIENKNNYLTTAQVSMMCEAFAGIGWDLGLIALKLGISGSLGGNYTLKNLDGWNVNYKEKSLDKEDMFGTNATVAGELALKFSVKILFFNYSKKLASASHEFINVSTGDYDDIGAWWKESMDGVHSESLDSQASLCSINEFNQESRAYLQFPDREWAGGSNKEPEEDGTYSLKLMQSNAYSYCEPIYNEDGSIIAYLSDSDSSDIEDTLASYAVMENGSYVNKHGIDPVTYTTDELDNETGKRGADGKLDPIYDADGKVMNQYRTTRRTGYGDSTLRIAGTKDFSAAAWVRQKNPIPDASKENPDYEDLSVMLNQAEICASIWTGDKWSTCTLTDNSVGDFSPAVAVNENYAVVAWRSCFGSDSGNPTDFNVRDVVNAKIYDRKKNSWGETVTLYDGQTGSVHALEAAIMSDGTAIAAYVIKTGSKADVMTDTEIMYTVLSSDGTVRESIRVTNDSNIDQNLQLSKVNWNGEEHFILGWFNERESAELDEEGKAITVRDIRLLAINSLGMPSSDFVESIHAAGAEVNSANFRFSKPAKNATLEDLSIVWLNICKEKAEEEKEEELTPKNTYVLSAIHFSENNNVINLSTPVEVARMNTTMDTIDTFSSYGDRDTIQTVLQSTNYSIDANDPNTYEVTEVPVLDDEDGTQKTKKIYTAVGKTSMYTVTSKYKRCSVEAEEVVVDRNNVLMGFATPVGFMVKNTGIRTIEKLTVSLDGKSTDFATELLPGESQTLSVYHKVPTDGIKDVSYSITAHSADGSSNPEDCSGIIKLNLPDVSIGDVSIVKEEDKERIIEVSLNNASLVPFEKGGKEIVVGLYDQNPESSSEELTPIDKVTIADNQSLSLVDADAYRCQFKLSAEKLDQIIKDHYTKEELSKSNHEIPENELVLYTKVWILDSTGEVQEEDYTGDNQGSVEIESLVDKYQSEYSISSYVDKQEDAVDAVVTIKNNYYAKKLNGNVAAVLCNSKGEVISKVKQTCDVTKEDKGIVCVKEEESKDVTIRFTKEDMLDGFTLEDAISISACYGSVDLGDLTAQLENFHVRGQKVSCDIFHANPVSVTKRNKKIYVDGELVDKRVEVHSTTYQSVEKLNERQLASYISVVPRNAGDEVEIRANGTVISKAIGAQIVDVRLLNSDNQINATVQSTPVKQMDVVRKTAVEDKKGRKTFVKKTERYDINKAGEPIDASGEKIDLTADDIEHYEEVYVMNESVYKATLCSACSATSEKEQIEKQKKVPDILLLKAQMLESKKGKHLSCKLTWNKISEADGYFVYGAKCNTANKSYAMKRLAKIKGNSHLSFTQKSLKLNQGYKYQVKAYKVVGGKQKVIATSYIARAFAGDKTGKYANPVKVKTAKESITIKCGKSVKVEAVIALPKGKKKKKQGPEKRYISSDKNIAAVLNSGKVVGKKKGSCYIYVIAQNGVYKKIKVQVK